MTRRGSCARSGYPQGVPLLAQASPKRQWWHTGVEQVSRSLSVEGQVLGGQSHDCVHVAYARTGRCWKLVCAHLCGVRALGDVLETPVSRLAPAIWPRRNPPSHCQARQHDDTSPHRCQHTLSSAGGPGDSSVSVGRRRLERACFGLAKDGQLDGSVARHSGGAPRGHQGIVGRLGVARWSGGR